MAGWLVYKGESQSKMDDLGVVPILGKLQIGVTPSLSSVSNDGFSMEPSSCGIPILGQLHMFLKMEDPQVTLSIVE